MLHFKHKMHRFMLKLDTFAEVGMRESKQNDEIMLAYVHHSFRNQKT